MNEFRKAIEVNPKSYEAHYQIGVAFADAGIYREAIRVWEHVIELAPDSDAAKAAKENIGVVQSILARKLESKNADG
jgi:tetratricopeptide (TPR) repeat protein